jgi:hypothetical protein
MTDLRTGICPQCGKAHNELEDCRDYVLAPVVHTWDETTKRWDDDDPKTDTEKHNFCLRRSGCPATYVPPNLYAAMEREHYDMRWYVITKPMPPMPVLHQPEPPDHLRYAEGKRKRTHHRVHPKLIPYAGQPKLGGMSRKHVSDKYCGGITCLPGLGGGCVACSEDDD